MPVVASGADSGAIFRGLREILRPYAATLVLKSDTPAEFHLDTAHVMENGAPLFFAAVRTGKRYVSFHLMPVYVEPGLLRGLSPALKRRMQGKSCFNFTAPDRALFDELARLVQAGFECYRTRGYVAASAGRRP